MSKYFECGIRYEKTLENGMQKKVTELYIVDALSFTEAERRITEEMCVYISGDFEVMTEKITNYSKVLTSDNAEADKWYKVKINFITVDEKTEMEKKNAVYYLVQAKDIDNARRLTNKHMQDSMVDWDCEAVSETKIMDVFFYEANKQATGKQASSPQTRNEGTSRGFRKAVKDFIDGIPKGQSVTISATGVGESVTIDKTGGKVRITTNEPDKPDELAIV